MCGKNFKIFLFVFQFVISSKCYQFMHPESKNCNIQHLCSSNIFYDENDVDTYILDKINIVMSVYLMQCFVYHLHTGVRAGGGIGKCCLQSVDVHDFSYQTIQPRWHPVTSRI